MRQRALVTGGCGFIGSHLTESLLQDGLAVRVVDDESTGSVANLSAVIEHPQLEYLRGSVTDPAIVEDAVADCDYVYHLAAAVGVALIDQAPIETIERNIRPVSLVLDALRRHQGRGRRTRFFLASSSEVYGKNPRQPWSETDELHFGATTCSRWSYGVSKAIDEFLALAYYREYDLPVVIARFFNVVGPRQTGAYGMVLPRFVAAARAGQPLIVHDDGQQQRCFAHVTDVVRAVRQLVDTPSAVGNVFNVGTDEPVSIRELAERVIQRSATDSTVQYQPYADAYSSDFQDVRRRVPDLSKLYGAIAARPQFQLADIIDELLGTS